MKISAPQLLCAVTLGAACASSLAATNVTVNVTGQDLKVSKSVRFDNNGNGNVSDDPQWTAGAFGRITGTLGGASFLTFCVELGQNWNLNNSKSYKLLDTGETSGGLSGFNTTTAQNLARLYQAAYSLVVDNKSAGAFQLAVWELTHETLANAPHDVMYYNANGTVHAGHGNFSLITVDSAWSYSYEYASLANQYLAAADALPANTALTWSVKKLANSQFQDYLVATPVPEPESAALLMMGLAAVGLGVRRRRAQ